MAANQPDKIIRLDPVPDVFKTDIEVWRFLNQLRERVGGQSGDLIYNASLDAAQTSASLEPLVYAVAQEVTTQLEGQIRAIIEEAQVDRIDQSSADNNVSPPQPLPDFSFDDFPIGALLQQARDNSPVLSVFGRTGTVIAVDGDYSLNQLGDVVITTPASNQVLSFNGTNWVNAAISATALSGVVPVANGGTGQSSLTANNVILGNGTSGVQFVAPGSSGNVLRSNGTTWTSAAPSPVAPGYDEFVATAGQTIINTTVSTVAKGSGKSYLQVFVNGVLQQEGATKNYTVTGATQLTFNTGLALNDDVVVYSFS